MIVTINGKEEYFSETLTIYDLLKIKDVSPDGVVVELNRDIIDKKDFFHIELKDRDMLEILRFVGGG